jgi:serine-type D-Ala-D-Ala carboxypeptidase (penicillin-binding protein 5/6)
LNIKNSNSFKLKFLFPIFFALTVISLSAVDTESFMNVPDVPILNARSAILIDNQTGTVLFEKNSTLSIPPASMTKLMTLYIVYKNIEQGRLSKDEFIRIGKGADFRSLPPHSSLMFLEEGQVVSIIDLMRGLAISSGNDAAIAIAIRIAGSVDSFVDLMNREATELGLESVHFDDASGLSSENSTNAADFARFCSVYINSFPSAIAELHSLRSFSYPKEENWLSNGDSVHGTIVQYNHSKLIKWYFPVDGLKTGYIDESGYNVALTGEMNGRRLIAVLLGGYGKSNSQGSLIRAIDGVNLLSYGFYRYTNVKSKVSGIYKPRVWKGSATNLRIQYPEIPLLSLTVEMAATLQIKVNLPDQIIAPITKGDIIGTVFQYSGNEVLGLYNITAAEDIPLGGFFRRLLDSIKIFFLKMTNDF